MKWSTGQLVHLMAICEGDVDKFKAAVEAIEAKKATVIKPMIEEVAE